MSTMISILGAGESGTGAALLAQAKGFKVFVSDSGTISDKYKSILTANHIEFEEQIHSENKLAGSSLVIKSPGIPESNEVVRKLIKKNIPVISEIEFAYRYTKARFIAITGSNGKTTTTLLTYHLLKNLGLNVGLAGNVGESLAKQVIEDTKDYYVLELSSYQLDGMFNFKAHIAILLNITPDHLDRYEYNFQKYVASKFRIINNLEEGDFFITLIDDPTIKNEVDSKSIKSMVLAVSLKDKVLNGAYLADSNIMLNLSKPATKYFHIGLDQLPLTGKHNMINTMCSLLAAAALGLNENKFEAALSGFQNAPHRLEKVAQINGVLFINDSKATNVDSVWYALDSINQPVVLIAGGIDKGNDYSQLQKLVKKKVKAIVCLGTDNSKLHEAFSSDVKIISTNDMRDAVTQAFSRSKPGYVVLLSPACSSFDLFKNYEDRGEQFKKAVGALLPADSTYVNRN